MEENKQAKRSYRRNKPVTKRPNKFSLLITKGKSTYVETIYSNGREKLIESLKPLLNENIEFIY